VSHRSPGGGVHLSLAPIGPSRPPGRPPLRRATVALLAAAVLMAGLAVAVLVDRHAAPLPTAPVAAAPVAAGPADGGAPAAALRATTLDVAQLGIRDQPLVELGVDGDGRLVPPDSPAVAGWFTGASAPGEAGPAVIAGHVDSRSGPGIFFRLRELREGAQVDVGRSDGRTAHYRVSDVRLVGKGDFPTDVVYGPTPAPELRLITCGGSFDRQARSYRDNVIVSAVLVDVV
jgi:hypothetical protein